MNGHTLFVTADLDRPKQICDDNGQVVLNMCKRCGKAESELDEPCTHKPVVLKNFEDIQWQRKTVTHPKGGMDRHIIVHNLHGWPLDEAHLLACLTYAATKIAHTETQWFDIYPRDPAHPPGPWVIRCPLGKTVLVERKPDGKFTNHEVVV